MVESIDTRAKNYRAVSLVLGVAFIVVAVISVLLKDPLAKKVCFGVALTFLIGRLTINVVFKMKPDAFKEKSRNPDEYPD
jgi:hypothetical protein